MKSSDGGLFTTAQLTVPRTLLPELTLSGNFEISKEKRAMENGLTLPSLAWYCQRRIETDGLDGVKKVILLQLPLNLQQATYSTISCDN